MIEEISKARARLVIKHNDLIQCIVKHKSELTAQQQKIISYILSLIDEKDIEENPNHIYKFSRKMFCEVCGIEPNNGKNIVNIKISLENIAKYRFWINTGKGILMFQWIVAPYIDKDSIEVQIPQRCFPYLIGLKKNFTCYELWQVLPLKSSYSISLYELLKSYSYKGEYIIDINELKKYLGIVNESNEELIKKGLEREKYLDFKDLKKRVLAVAKEEINRLTDLYIDWEGIREGRNYKKIKFIIHSKDTLEVYESYKNAKEALDGKKDT